MDDNAVVLQPNAQRGQEPDHGAEGHREDALEAISLTVLVPTRNEAENVAKLLDDLSTALEGVSAEVVFVDDSDDSTPAVIEAEATRREATLPTRLVRRKRGQRAGGLSGAVVAGLRVARGRWVCVMDGDLQHPPAVVPRLLHEARDQGASLVVASRYCGDGDASGLSSRGRRVISRSTTSLTKSMFPRRLGDITDPMSGFFLFERERVDIDSLKPMGFKILLEIAARTPHLRVAEVPFVFAPGMPVPPRPASEGVRFAGHLLRLRCATVRRGPRRGHFYDIHGLVCVDSERRLPELEDFRVRNCPGPTSRSRSRRCPWTRPRTADRPATIPSCLRSVTPRSVTRGFGVDIEVNGKVDVQTTRLVGRSPHVLVHERRRADPALAHRRAGLRAHSRRLPRRRRRRVPHHRAYRHRQDDDGAEVLDSYPYEFISDDLTLVAPDGTGASVPQAADDQQSHRRTP